ncbi:unnamed protein product [Cylicocyclus nassatus]|uniref:Uncharacterized protein n=1 Tax=Cylicocyclus nassatus TaxID=53992 RepID=A0AA36DSZ4_CYLNA|nr:unnamed protein product [Cylicocyclus nassatus]
MLSHVADMSDTVRIPYNTAAITSKNWQDYRCTTETQLPFISTLNAMSTATPSISAKTLHKYGAFDMDENAIFRAFIVVGGLALLTTIYCVIKCCRTRASRSRVRKYDLMSAKDLQRTALAVDSDSEDDLFESAPSDRLKLVPPSSS